MNLAGFSFAFWQWLLLLPLLWLYLAWWYQQNKSASLKPAISDIDLSAYNHFYHPLADKFIQASKSKQQIKQSFWKKSGFWLNSLIISGLIIALAQPVLIGKRLPDPPPERDIVFLVDTSVSMQLKDYQQEGVAIRRIDVLLNLLNEFTTKMAGEKISVILFAENAYVLVPLSSDQNLIQQMLKRISVTLAGRYTAVGDALLMALNESKKVNAKQSNNRKPRHQTFVLFTDADISRGKVSSVAAAKIIAEHGIPVFTIAIGSSQKGENKEVQGGLYHAVNLPLLKDIADTTGGKSYRVHDSEAMQQALDSILQQRQNIAVPKAQYEQRSLYFLPLLLSLMLLVLMQVYRLLHQLRITNNKENLS